MAPLWHHSASPAFPVTPPPNRTSTLGNPSLPTGAHSQPFHHQDFSLHSSLHAPERGRSVQHHLVLSAENGLPRLQPLLCSQHWTWGQPGFVFPTQTSGLHAAMAWLHKAWQTRGAQSSQVTGGAEGSTSSTRLRSCCQDENIHPLHKSPSGPPKTDSLESFSADGLISPAPWFFFEATQKITQRPACCQDTQIYYTPVQAEWKRSWLFSTQEDSKRSSQTAVCIIAVLTDLRAVLQQRENV